MDDNANRPLTDPAYWDGLHPETDGAPSPARPSKGSPLKRLVRILAGPSTLDFVAAGGYRQYLVVERILARHLPVRSDWDVLEVGSAPGKRLLELRRRFGYRPHGVDYSVRGVEQNRRLFAAAGLDPTAIEQADFFSGDYQRRHAGRYEVVYSNGFIEHFTDARDPVARHVDLLKPSGRLVIIIPNLTGLNLLLARFFNPDIIPLHNLQIMTLPAFERLFDGLPLQRLFCGYAGLFSFGLQNTPPGSWKRLLLRVAWNLEAAGEVALWRTLGPHAPAHPRLSPYLIYVGKRT